MTEVTRREAEAILGYAPTSLATLMNRHPDRWPSPVGRRRVGRVWALTYDLDALRAATGTSTSRLTGAASLSDADGLITCLDCGRRYRNLEPHLRHKHHVTPAEYRAVHQLPATGSTRADVTRNLLSRIAREKLTADPHAIDHLTPYQTPAHTQEISRRGKDAVRASHSIPLAQEHRLPGRQYAVTRMVEQRLQKLETAAREHGYASVADAIEQTRHLPARHAARLTGLSAQTITRRRSEP